MISIVVPAYNAADVIGACIDSILQQTYSDFELIIVDDGSTDNTSKVVADKAAQDSRIRLICQSNAGVSSARNTGIDVAAGELLCFVDCDDTVSENYLEVLCGLYCPGVLPIIDVIRSDRDGSALSPFPAEYLLEDGWVDSYFCGALRYGIAFSVWNKLYSLQTVRRKQIRFLPELSIGEDMLFVFQYLHYCHSIRFSNKARYYYTITPGSAMLSAKDYSPLYDKTFQAMTEQNRFPTPIDKDTLYKWAFDAVVILIVNPFIVGKSYAEFAEWWKVFRQTSLYRAAMISEKPAGYKRWLLYSALHLKNAGVIYILLRLLKQRKKK